MRAMEQQALSALFPSAILHLLGHDHGEPEGSGHAGDGQQALSALS